MYIFSYVHLAEIKPDVVSLEKRKIPECDIEVWPHTHTHTSRAKSNFTG
jgi:hypothetical protein